MKSISLIPMINKKLSDEFCSRRIMDNPRMTEVDDILLSIAINYGTMLEERSLLDPYCMGKLQDRAYHLLYMSDIIEVVGVNLRVTMPVSTRMDSEYSRSEVIDYEPVQEGYLKRTRRITEKDSSKNKESISVSIINGDGIEIERRTTVREGSEETTFVYQRIIGNPNVVKRTTDGIHEETFYDMTKSNKFEDLVDLEETKIDKEQIKPMNEEQKRSILENNRYSDYIEGIKKIIGKQKTVDENTER